MQHLKNTRWMIMALCALMLAGCATEANATQEPAITTEPDSEATTGSTGEAVEDNSDAFEEVVIDIKLFNFPDVVEVPVGTTVTWINQDDIRHSVTSGIPDNPGGPFDSDYFVQGEKFSYTFTEPGDYPYFCMRHNHMQGIIRVVAK